VIERLQIENFQKHRRLRVVFDPQVTTICGPSDAGKSAILRAVRWLAWNRPRGDGFVRHGEKHCSVKLWVDGRKLERRKDKSGNQYLIDGRELKAVGTDVPEEIAGILNIAEESFQGQHDPLFWFSLTAGEVARRLNAIVDLEAIDRSATYLAGQLRKANARLSVVEERREAAENAASDLAHAPLMARQWKGVLAWADRRDAAQGRAGALSGLLAKATESHARYNVLSEAAATASRLLEKASSARDKRRQAIELSGTLDDVRDADRKASRPVPSMDRLTAAYNKVEQIGAKAKDLRNLIQLIASAERKEKDAEEELDEARIELEEKTDGRCPLCGGAMQ